jgi:hypothetical protein
MIVADLCQVAVRSARASPPGTAAATTSRPDGQEARMTTSKRSLSGSAALALIALSLAVPAIAGDPVPDVDLSLERKPGRLIRQVKTDPQGNFSFGFVQEGDYVITVRPNAAPAPRKVGTDANAVAPGSTAKSFFESRSNTVRTSGANPTRLQVTVNAAGAGTASRSVPIDSVQQIPVRTSGGQLGGRITAP